MEKFVKMTGFAKERRELSEWEWGDFPVDSAAAKIIESIHQNGASVVLEQMEREFSYLICWPEVVIWPLGTGAAIELKINIKAALKEYVQDKERGRYPQDREEDRKFLLKLEQDFRKLGDMAAACAAELEEKK